MKTLNLTPEQLVLLQDAFTTLREMGHISGFAPTLGRSEEHETATVETFNQLASLIEAA